MKTNIRIEYPRYQNDRGLIIPVFTLHNNEKRSTGEIIIDEEILEEMIKTILSKRKGEIKRDIRYTIQDIIYSMDKKTNIDKNNELNIF